MMNKKYVFNSICFICYARSNGTYTITRHSTPDTLFIYMYLLNVV